MFSILSQEKNAIKTANYFLLSGSTLSNQATMEKLAEYDLLVLPAEAQVYNPTFSQDIREINPDILLLAYVPTVSWNNIWQDRLHKELYNGIESSFWLKTTSSNNVSIWTGTQALDLTSGWNNYLSEFVAYEILYNDYWDGVFYDEVSDSISWVGNIKLSNNASNVDSGWQDAYVSLFAKTRALVGSNKIIITNGSSNLDYTPYVNGRMFESFPTPWEGNGSWGTNMANYLTLEDAVSYDPVILLNSDTSNTGNSADYQKVRFGLSSALLGDGFFGFDYGTQSHSQLWHYDEYDAYIGSSKSDAQQATNGVWTREFTNGKVVVNPTSSNQTVKLNGEFEKLHGEQDPNFNDGSIISSLTLNSQDGAVLVRPLAEILGGVFLNGAFARIFDGNGQTYRTGFFSYNENYIGGTQIMTEDINFDGNNETVVADANQVFIYNSNGTLHASFYPYTENYRGGVNIAIGDLENDGSIEIVTGTEAGGGAHVRVFNADGVLINPGFFAYDEVYRGGVNVAVGDLNGDGTREIICGAGLQGGPHVRIFNKDGKLINPGFFAYDINFRGGVNVASGDVNGDGIDEIITGPGYGGLPEIKVWNNDGVQLTSPFLALESSAKVGVKVSTADLDNDGIDEIIAFTQDVFTFSNY
ncbi:VCBS repeat-containing protein [Patescibacteria group bacterium]|nr:VCBS repeat-containing protein [Patescibacteria group bacterium]MBU4453151.1 VCBS repeat-containing protein [Patescibacteria group bacterium]MCG2687360.1 putative glycoside hydrolase [Candidatus Parcubacteria bacterium]